MNKPSPCGVSWQLGILLGSCLGLHMSNRRLQGFALTDYK